MLDFQTSRYSAHRSKKMAAIHFTTIPCEHNTTKEANHRHIFPKFVRILTILCRSALTFLIFCTFLSACLVFSCAKNYRCNNVLVAIFFSTVDQSRPYLTEASIAVRQLIQTSRYTRVQLTCNSVQHLIILSSSFNRTCVSL